MICRLLIILALSYPFEFRAQSPQQDLELVKGLKEITRDFNGTAGVYVYNLKTGKEAAINQDTIFPTASIVKVPILIALFDKINSGELSLNDTLIYRDERVYGGSGLMQFFKDSTQTDLRTLAALMITYSDNVTSIWSQELAGGGEAINKIMEELGLQNTRVNSRTKGREENWEEFGWGQTTPKEMASLLVKMRNRKLVSAAASDEMYRMMTNSFYTDYSLSQIPPYVQTAAKQGMVDRSRSELVMVNAPGGDYVFYVATKENEDASWEYDNESWVLQRKISAYLWNYFEPESKWKPADGSENLVRGLKY
ncbi:class A beta-lactamase-related serine hydrolase [Antarcticibacterium sp. 1MA-6-2]|uniref:serine hydrolase n=1 Tax=Antarcticibacterium sp. 1MA-6-2 TaxID=2908210 RepID=UPI001F463479|nr:serine hydrolase [Antarcticibacterium sp. 1MA-6-2]UJH91097.1 class A beta-lactamase-related serine hydrolase [Antarcticibacterium sp. 1MA-6-2]